jgi:hypothetical protein
MEKMESVEAQIRALKDGTPKTSAPDESLILEIELAPLEKDLAKYALFVIVFSMMTIESYLYDYAARHLSDKFVKDYVDKLDVIGKLAIVPRLITGKELPRNKKWFSLIKNVVKARNLIVHSKSSAPPFAEEEARRYLAKIKNTEDQIMQSAKQAVEPMDILVVELSVIDPDEAIWIEGYLSGKSQLNVEAQ